MQLQGFFLPPPPDLGNVGNTHPTDIKWKQFQSSVLGASVQFSLSFLDSIIESLRKLDWKENLSNGELTNLQMILSMTALHRHLHYGHPIGNQNLGHDIIEQYQE